MKETIHIFHTNDIHSHFNYWFRSQAFIKAQRTLLAERGEASLLIDIGDHMDRSNIYTEATLGRGNVKLLNEAQYDVVTLGNNEGITLSFEELSKLYEDAQFEVIVGNLQATNGRNPAWMKPYTIMTTKQGTKIGMIAATAQFDSFYDALGWQVVEPRLNLVETAYRLRDEVDVLLCLSHLGITEDRLLAEECPVIDVIFGAHTHHVLLEGELVNGVLLTGGGKFGQYTGHLTLQLDREAAQLQKQVRLIENALLPEIEQEMEWLHNLHDEAKKRLTAPLFQLTKTYHKEWFHYSQLSDLFAEAVFDYTDADCALFNAGIFVDQLSKGNVSAYTMHKVLPHPINLCVIECTGRELREIYSQSQNEEWPRLELKGLGFRGVIFGKLLHYKLKMNKKRELFINGELVEPNKHYKLATLDLFTFGYFFPNFKYTKKHYYLPAFLRDILREYCKKNFE